MPEFELNKVKSTKLVGANEFLPLSPINDKKIAIPFSLERFCRAIHNLTALFTERNETG